MKSPHAHVASDELALLAGGELPLGDRCQSLLHVFACDACRHEYRSLQAARRELRAMAAGPEATFEGEAWSALESEMRANVRLGLAAGALTGGEPLKAAPERSADATPLWRWAAVCGALAFTLSAGWWLRQQQPGHTPLGGHTAGSLTRLDGGTAVREAGFELLVPVSGTTRTEGDFAGGARSRTIDRETGQVTLQQVYVE